MNEALRKKLSNLALKHDTPFFVLNKAVLRQNLSEFKKTARKFFPKFEVCYSVKTNSSLEVLKELNCGFEVSNLKEMKLVKKNKAFKVFNSPCKNSLEIKEALRQGMIIIADSFSDLEKISKIAWKKRKALKIGLRLNYNSKKFGFSIKQFSSALKFCKFNELNVVMLHCHPGTMQSVKQYELFLKHFSKAVKLHDWRFLNFGGGFPSFSEMHENNCLDNFFEKIQQIFGKNQNRVVVFEPGRVLVENAFFLISKVCSVKELNGIKIAVLDAGINLLQKIALSNFKFSPLGTARSGKTLLVGPLLFNNDIFSVIRYDLRENEFVVVENVGAYCMQIAWRAFENCNVFKL